MHKIPVGKVISESFNFAFQKYLPLVGVLWLSTALVTIGAVFAISALVG